ncbi:Pyruvate dehydrogenase (acetyl-transferring) [Lentibacillus sp. JNUCC-1]|nr:Pyruvate dehydrogenase (acetyl-transferring) [Lentibacillus sp. JNUCC-1]
MKNEFPISKIINDDGTLLDESYETLIDVDLAYRLYDHMYRIRTFDRKAISLQRQGRIGTYPPFEGQEAAQVGSALALGEDDWVFPTYRDHGATLTFGADMTRMFLYWNGRVEGCVPPEGKRIFPAAVPIATQIPHAVGAA